MPDPCCDYDKINAAQPCWGEVQPIHRDLSDVTPVTWWLCGGHRELADGGEYVAEPSDA